MFSVVIKQELHEAWFLCSSGFSSCGEKEIAFALEKRIAEDVFPYEMVKVYRTIYSFIVNRGWYFSDLPLFFLSLQSAVPIT